MMTMPSTWVILVNYNGAEDTIECIRSLQATKMDNMRILIVDNASKEQDKEKLQTVLDDKVECLFLPENFGFGVANNKGVAYALSKDAEYLLLLNNDTIVSQDLFCVFYDRADKNRVLVPAIYYYDCPSEFWYAGGEISRWKGTSVHRTKVSPEGQVGFATGCCIFLHRSIVERYGLFDENYFMYYEDTDFSIKMQQCGVMIYYVPSAKIWHKVGRSSKKITGFQEYYLQRNRLYLIYKYRKHFLFLICMMYFIITRGIMLFVRAIQGTTLKYVVKGILDFGRKKYRRQSVE